MQTPNTILIVIVVVLATILVEYELDHLFAHGFFNWLF
jgi:preprotein translocase subunit SecE